MNIARLLMAVALAFGVPGSSSGQEMKPLGEVAANSARAYPFVRCGGLYQAVMEWAGRDRLGEDTWARYDAARTNFLLAAVMTAVDEGLGSPVHASEVTARDARNIADIYLSLFEANYARQGEMLGRVSKSDLVFCTGIASPNQTND